MLAKSNEIRNISPKDNYFWVLERLPIEKGAIWNKWMHKIKYHTDGTVERLKLRLVAKVYIQVQDEDFIEISAHTSNVPIVLCQLAIVIGKRSRVLPNKCEQCFPHGELY